MLFIDIKEGAGETVGWAEALHGVLGGLGEDGETGGGALPPVAGVRLGWLIMASCRRLLTSSAVARCRGVWPSCGGGWGRSVAVRW